MKNGMKAVFKTDKGRLRTNNEDSGGIFLNQDSQHLIVVADGMGGHQAGDVASQMTVSKLQEMWEKSKKIETADEAEEWLRHHIKEVNRIIFEYAKKNEHCEGMGTTIEAMIVTENFTTSAHVGDSRSYILNNSGFRQLTEDHTLVNELVRNGQISKEDAEHHPRKNVILRALGTEEDIKIDIKTVLLEEGDFLLLCSDGLSNKVLEEDMVEVLKNDDSVDQKAAALIDMANANGGEDNITLIILHFTNEMDEEK